MVHNIVEISLNWRSFYCVSLCKYDHAVCLLSFLIQVVDVVTLLRQSALGTPHFHHQALVSH